ncbi:MAG: nucleotidyltransferase [Lentisphaerae bacterium GWF2_52_8]|nr:MAG: nucleotidyltransferase [Lentisphaerae bacterium GWF2_52_8]
MKPTLLVLAAGIGSRYGGLKQIDPVGPNGEIIIDYSIYDAIRAGFGKVVFVIRRDIEAAFKECISSRFAGRIPIDYAFQELDKLPNGFKLPEGRQKPWGTGHAILCAEEQVREPFAVINADDFYGRSGYELLAKQLSAQTPQDSEYSMVGFVLRKTLSEYGSVCRGLCNCNAESFLSDVTELTKIEKTSNGAQYTDDTGRIQPLTGDEIVSMNMWGFTPSLFPQLRRLFVEFLEKRSCELKSEFYIPSAVDTLIKEKKASVRVLRSGDSWFGITYKEDKPQVLSGIKELLENKQYPAKLFA